jgi:filamentous hemagglutinin family protein
MLLYQTEVTMRTKLGRIGLLFAIPLLLSTEGQGWAQLITPAADGTGTIVTPQGSQYDITGGQTSGNGANLFHSFDRFGLDAGQIANFLSHPNTQNILSRVVGGEASFINGLIQVTGSQANLYLMNPSGILFGASASLNVPAAFTATTANGIQIGDEWFKAVGATNYANLVGTPHAFAFTTPQPGSIFNAGNLSVGTGQSLTLLGGTVVNTGTIAAPGGNITIMAVPGEKFVRISQASSPLSLDLPLATQSQLNGNGAMVSPLALPALLTGGNLTGATGVIVENGVVKLTSSSTPLPSEPGTTLISGTLSTVSDGAASLIQVLGDRVGLLSASIDASATSGGGTVLIGGDYQGQGTIPTAQSTFVSQDSTIHADAIAQGNGGKVIVWADDTTRFYGSISAQGGVLFGNGGFVETSGKQTLDVNHAQVNTSATAGQPGVWLLDPTNINIANGGTGVILNGIFDPATTGVASTIAPATIAAALNGGTSVTITTNSGVGGNGDITLTDSINQAGGGAASLTLTGRRFIRPGAATINMNSTGGLTFNINQVNPEANPLSSSIQAAIDAIGNVAGARTINLGAGTYTLGNTINIAKNLTLNGAGAGNTRVSGNNAVRVFSITGGTVTLNGLTIANGNQGADPIGGGGLLNTSNLTLNNSVVENNTSNLGGGGIRNSGTMVLNNVTVRNNTNLNAFGGGIDNVFGGNLTLNNSLVANNSSLVNGGGIDNFTNATLVLNNSTVSGNSASLSGGGIHNEATSNITLNNSTVAGNSAATGGGINNVSGSSFSLRNSIVSGNTASGSPDVNGTFVSLGNNIIGNSAGGSGFVASDLLNVNPLLAPLGNYGGVTFTHALLPGSPAINAAGAGATAADQRGVTAVGVRDIGAFESRQGFVITASTGNGQTTNVTRAFNTPLTITVASPFGEPVAGGLVTFTVPTTGASATLNSTTVTINAAGQASVNAIANATPGSYAVIASARGANNAAFNLSNLLFGNLTVDTLLDENDNNTSLGDISLREAIAFIDTNGTITFNPALSGGTITTALGAFTINRSMTIDGAGATSLTISGNNANQVFNVSGAGTIANINSLTITQGRGINGGGIYNFGGANLTVNNSTITNNNALGLGGTVGGGGGIYNESATLTVNNSTISNNIATGSNGGGGSGAGLYNFGGGILTVNNSTITNNTGDTLGSGTAAGGGGIVNWGGTLIVTNSTITGNRLTSSGSNSLSGGGISNFSSGSTLRISNSIVAGNTALTGREIHSSIAATSEGNNLFGFNSNSGLFNVALAASDIVPTVPLSQILAPLGNYGGATLTHALLPGSPAINAAGAGATAADQRGIAVVGGVRDIGAFESRGFVVSAAGGSGQTTNVTRSFNTPLTVAVSSLFGEPVAGGSVTFNAPATGASATFNRTPALINANGQASVNAVANGTPGGYAVTATTSGSNIAAFNLSNILFGNLTVDTLLDENDSNTSLGDVSLREAIAFVDTNGTIDFAPSLAGGTITLGLGELGINRSVSILGPGATNLAISGNNSFRVFNISGVGTTVTLNGLTIRNGFATTGGGIFNNGSNVTATNLIVSNNLAASGGGISNQNGGTFILNNSQVINNQATNTGLVGGIGYQLGGGGIFNSASMTIDSSTVANNTAARRGGGIQNMDLTGNGSTLSVLNSAITGNSSGGVGGGIDNVGNGTGATAALTLSNSTVSGNSSSLTAGVSSNGVDSQIGLLNTTIANNFATNGFGGIWNADGGTVNLSSTIIANNVSRTNPDVTGTYTSQGNNLIGNTTGAIGFGGGDLLNVNPLLAALGNYGGTSQTHALLPGSPAIDAASTGATATDQRGATTFGVRDIGAFESQGFTLTASNGTPQSTNVARSFAVPLTVTVQANNGIEPVVGGIVNFAAPTSSATAILGSNSAVINNNGQASVTASANTGIGSYAVTANTRGAANTAIFNLNNSLFDRIIVDTLSDDFNNNLAIGDISLREAIAFTQLGGTIDFSPNISGGTINVTGTPLSSADRTLNNVNTNITSPNSLTFGNLFLGNNVIFSTTAPGSNISLLGSVNGNYTLTLNTPGTVQINNAIGNITPLSGLTVNASANITSNIITNGDINFGNTVNINKNSAIQANSGAISSNGTITTSDNSQITLAADGDITVNNIVSSAGILLNSGGKLLANVLDTSGTTAGGNITVNGDRININTLNTNASNGRAGTVNLAAQSDAQINSLTAQGGNGQGGTVNLSSGDGLSIDNLTTSSNTGGAVNIDSGGALSIRNLDTSGTASGGAIRASADSIDIVNQLNSSGSIGSGGGIDLTSQGGSIQLSSVNAQGGDSGQGGIVTIDANGFFRATDSFVDRNGLTTTISTSGGLGGGAIRIEYISTGTSPFTIGAIGGATSNGTITSIATSSTTRLDPLQQFPRGVTFNNITIAPKGVTNPPEFIDPPSPPPDLNIAAVDAFGGDFTDPQSIIRTLSKITEQTETRPAIIYVFAQGEELQLAVFLPDGKPITKSFPINRQRILRQARSFINEVSDPRKTRTTSYLKPAQQLYQWLVEPIAAELEANKIDTLLFAMDTGLRSLPVAALHDGEQFLVQKYSLALIPSITLTDTRYQPLKDAQVLAMGASEFKDQAPLPAVPVELALVTQDLWQGKSFLNKAFTLENLKFQRFETPYRIIHLATHGEFQAGSLDNSYIQLWDTKLRLDELRQLNWNDPPVDLLVLSACRTAFGDDETELGFAGIAFHAGVKSVLASLWYVSDEGTLGLVTEFYRQLKTAPIKAEALQQAQIAMLEGKIRLEDGQLRGIGQRGGLPLPPELAKQNDRQFVHPFFWAAFTMIGSPW